jgi:hypothetical protein
MIGGVPVTGEAQGISEQEAWRRTRLLMAMVDSGKCKIEDRAVDGVGVAWIRVMDASEIASAALADRDRELAELRAKIAEVEHLVRDAPYFRAETPPALAATLTGHTVGGCECPRCVAIRAGLAALASSGSAPTGQEER